VSRWSISGRRPALLDNIFQVLSAPLFVVIELFDLLGVRTKSISLWKEEIEFEVRKLRVKDQ
jgi:uncharacterized membrane protein YGL010W